MSVDCPIATAHGTEREIRWTGNGTCPLAQEVSRRIELGLPAPEIGCAECIYRLSTRLREVLVLIADGFNTTEIAAKLFVCTKTIESHRKQIFQVLRTNRVALITKYSIRAGLTSL
jgi:DNA-binding NarL/FixJ family response regulator